MEAHDLALAYSLSTIAGLRAAFMLLVVSAAIHLNLLHPSPTMTWMGSDQTLLVTGLLTIADFFGDKIPLIDHALHVVHTVLAPASGGIVAMTVGSGDPTIATVLGVIGGANALGVHGVRSATRVGSSATTFGFLTPFISIGEDAVAFVATIAAFAAPFFTAIVAVVVTIASVIFGRKIYRRIRRTKQGDQAA